MISIKHDNQYISYVLENNAQFYPTGYRVLKKQKDKGLISCFKTNYNGCVKLLYPIQDEYSVLTMAESWGLKEVYEWILRIIKAIKEVRDSGFLYVDNVDMDLSRVFIDLEKKEIHLIVLPLTIEGRFCQQWEKDLENMFVSIIEISQMSNEHERLELKQVIHESTASLDLMYKKIKILVAEKDMDIHTEILKNKEKTDSEDKEYKGELHLVTKNASKIVDIAITKDVAILGKNPKLSDYVLDISPTISRQHCKIMRENDGYYIEDMDSLNHTYVNDEMLTKGRKIRIQKGMKIRLSEVEFEVEFRN